MSQTFEVTFRYTVEDTSGYDTDEPQEMADIDYENISSGETDISDLFDEEALDTLTINPV